MREKRHPVIILITPFCHVSSLTNLLISVETAVSHTKAPSATPEINIIKEHVNSFYSGVKSGVK